MIYGIRNKNGLSMLLNSILWLLVWGGMFTDIGRLSSSFLFSNPLSFVQGIRAIFPILALYMILIWILGSRSEFPFAKNPLRFLLFYCLMGIIVSIFLSPDIVTSLYWAGLYISPLFVMWILLEKPNALASLRMIININFGVSAILALLILPQVFQGQTFDEGRAGFYNLPFNLGRMRANGVGRFALILIIFSTVRFMSKKNRARYIYLGIIFPSLYILARSQSRTALLGLAVGCILFILMKHADWRFVFAGPIAAYVIWISGIQWRAQGRFDNLVNLTGRQMTWERALDLIRQSPFLGWGFHADRLLVNSEHMHNSYLHALIQSGLIGTVAFIAAFIGIWRIIIKNNLIGRIYFFQGPDQGILMESILLLGFMTARSFFESTGAFYGVDLLIIVPSMTFIHLWTVKNIRMPAQP